MNPNGHGGWYPDSRGGNGRQMSMTGDDDSDVDRDESGYRPAYYNDETSRSQGDLDPYCPRGGQTNQLTSAHTQQGNSKGHNGTGVRTDSASRGNERRSASTSNYYGAQQSKDTNKKKK
ncbi:hypothetical protein BDN67DRAFT_963622 [Paxillus ammoniavirescens]|nr:hypothetical protein BDN67DRAFT_963622 [Paxillus ammoniavirescens]